MTKLRSALAVLCAGLVGCFQGAAADFIPYCEQQFASIDLVTQDAGSIIASATVEGCPARISILPTCEKPVSAVQAFSTTSGGLCVFKVYATNGKVFVASSQLETAKLTRAYKCSSDPGRVHDVDSYLTFSPSLIIVDFESADAGQLDVQACATSDGGIARDVR